MMVLVVVIMIVLDFVLDDGGSDCDGIGGCDLLSFISYIFKTLVYFKQCCNMTIDKTKQQKPTQKCLISSAKQIVPIFPKSADIIRKWPM